MSSTQQRRPNARALANRPIRTMRSNSLVIKNRKKTHSQVVKLASKTNHHVFLFGNGNDSAASTTSAQSDEGLMPSSVYTDMSYLRKRAGDYVDISKPTGVPKSVLSMAERHFVSELKAMIREVLLKRNETIAMTDDDLAVQYALSRTFDESVDDEDEDSTTAAATKNKEQGRKALEMINSLRLSNELVWERERAMPKVESPWVIEIPYIALCALLDVWFPETKPIQRFWFLETVARMPYFSYTSMLTLYEILGWWRRSSDLRKVHFAEEWNEYHHLLIMESLGGDRAWSDRFLAQHAALAYYLGLIVMWLLSPALAYNFSEKIETHAVATYAQFVEENAELLASLPAPEIAKKYYEADDLYLFDEFQTTTISKGEILLNKLDDIKGKKEEDVLKTRRPVITTLKDVFDNICEDEKEHVGTMNACQMPDMTLATANRINALIAVGGVALVASKYAERFATTLAEDSAATDGLEDLIGSGRLLDLITFLTSLFSDLPFL